MSKKFQKIFATLDKTLASLKDAPRDVDSGSVEWIKDGVMQIKNITGIRLGEIVTVEPAHVPALVMQVDHSVALAVLLARSGDVKPGHKIQASDTILTMPGGPGVLGRVLNVLGEPLDNRGPVKSDVRMPLDAQAPQVLDRDPVKIPLETGILAVDALIPIGRGQRELIIGDRQTGKTTLALDAIINQKGKDVICVYVAIGQRDGTLAHVVSTLEHAGAMDYTVVVSASASDPAALQYLAPYAGQAVAEYFMNQGKHALIVFDDLTKQAVAYREIALLLRRPPGREAYPGDVFYLHSRLLERAAQLSAAKGGGSVTALPIIETLGGDVSAYIPTNVISITDGQIFLESSLFNRGVRPAINVGISVSRVGGAAQTKAMKAVAGSAKLQLAQYYELAAFSQFSSELDQESKKKLIRGERLVESLKQSQHQPLHLWEEILVLKSAMDGYFDDVDVTSVPRRMLELREHVSSNHADVVRAITKEKQLTPEITSSLEAALKTFFQSPLNA